MASFMNKALAYLGLKDIDDDFYDDEYLDDHEVNGQGTYVEHEVTEPRTQSHTIRPVAAEEPAPSNGRSAVVRPLVSARAAVARPQVVAPARFADAQEIGDLVKSSTPVIVNLSMSDRDLARRMIDFCSGLTYALGGAMEKVADQVFLLTPSNVEVSPEERQRLQERGLFRP